MMMLSHWSYKHMAGVRYNHSQLWEREREREKKLTTDCSPIGGSGIVQWWLLAAVVNWCCRRCGYLLWLISDQSHVTAWRSSSIDYYRCWWHQPHGSPIPNTTNISHHYRAILIIVRRYYLVLTLHLHNTNTPSVVCEWGCKSSLQKTGDRRKVENMSMKLMITCLTLEGLTQSTSDKNFLQFMVRYETY